MITRRGFFGLLGGFAAAEVARKTIYCFAPPMGWNVSQGEAMFYLPADGWVKRCAMPNFQRETYRYAYRNIVTGCVSDATPEIARLQHTFMYPEVDVVDIYRKLADEGFEYAETVGAWGTNG